MAISIGDAVLEIGGDTTKLKRSLEGIGKQMQKTGKNLTLKLTAPLVAFAGLSLKTAADFSRSMAKVNAVTGATEDQFAELTETAKKLGRTTQFTATQVAQAMSFMGMAGMDANEILSSIPHTLNLAAAGAIDLATASDIVTNVMAGFGIETAGLEGAVDILAKAFTSSNTDLIQLGEAMKFAGPIAKGFGMSFEETAAILGLFGNAGIQASMAGTTLRGALVRLDKRSQELGLTIWDTAGKLIPMADILTQLEERGVSTSEMMELFGLRAGPGMVAVLSQGIDSLKDFTRELENAGGTAQRIAEVQMEGLHGTIIRLKSAFEGLQLAVAEEITPGFEGLTEKLTDAFRAFADLPKPIRATAVALGILAAVVGPLIWMSGTLVVNFTALKVSFIGAAISGAAVNAVLYTMLGLNVGLNVAIGILVGTVLALVAGLSLMYFGLKAIADIEEGNATRAKAYARLMTEQHKAVMGLKNEYRKAAKEAEFLGMAITAAQWKHITLTELAIQASEEHAKALDGVENEYVDILEQIKKLGVALSEEQDEYIKAMKDWEAGVGIWGAIADAEARSAQELEMYLRVMRQVQDALRGLNQEAGIYFVAGGIREQLIQRGLIQRAPVSGGEFSPYANGGPILGPTALTSLRTGQTYAIAGEAGPERVVPSGGGTEHMTIEVLGTPILDILGEKLIARARLRTGIQF